MMGRISNLRHSYAAITSTVALVLALGMGGAYAADKISSKQITASAVKSKHIKDGGVRTNDLAADVEVASARNANTAKTADSAKRADTANAVAPNAVNSAAIADGAVGTPELADESVLASKLGAQSVSGQHILDGSVASADLSPGSVGAHQLESVTATRSATGQPVNPGQAKVVTVQCPEGTMVIGAGHSWAANTEVSIIASAPSELNPKRVWHVTGFVPSGGTANTLFAWANCLAA